MRNRLPWLGLTVLAACVSTPETAAPPTHGEIVEATREVLVWNLAGLPTAPRAEEGLSLVKTADTSNDLPSGLSLRLRLLANASLDREGQNTHRLRRLERLRDESEDRLFQKTVTHLLEQEDVWMLEELQSDQVYSQFAGMIDGVTQSGYSLLAGNPVGVIQPLVRGVDDLFRDDPLDARDRKMLDIWRREMIRGREEASLSSEELQEQVEDLHELIFQQELMLFDDLMEEKRLDAAAAHLHVARTRRPGDARITEYNKRLGDAITQAKQRLEAGLAIRPLEDAPIRSRDSLSSVQEDLVVGLLAGRVGILELELQAEDVREAGHEELANSFSRAAATLADRADPMFAVRQAEEQHSQRVKTYILTGQREVDSPLLRYRVAAAESQRSILDVLEPILWLPATLGRSVRVLFTDPVSDQPVVDALAAAAASADAAGDDLVRGEILTSLCLRYEERGELQKAIAVARAIPLSAAELERLVKSLDAQTKENAPDDTDGTPSGYRIPPSAAHLVHEELGLDPAFVDGREANGEIKPPGLLLDGDRLEYTLIVGEEEKEVEVILDGELARKLNTLAAEWRWRRRAAAAVTYHDLHDGVPVELRGGIGFGGVGIYPRLLPEEYRSADRRLYE